MSYLENRKKIELEESPLDSMKGNLEDVVLEIKRHYKIFSERVNDRWDYETFVLFESRYGYYSDSEIPHLVAYRWETECEYNLRVEQESENQSIKREKELKLLKELKAKYGDV